MWVIALFVEDNTIAIVPTSWVRSNNECYWPTASGGGEQKFVKECTSPDKKTWRLYKVRILGNGKVFDDWNKARLKLPNAETESDFNTDHEKQVQKKRVSKKRRFFDSDSDTDNETPRKIRTELSQESISIPLPEVPFIKSCVQPSTSAMTSRNTELAVTPHNRAHVIRDLSPAVCSSPEVFSRNETPKINGYNQTDENSSIKLLLKQLLRQVTILNGKINNVQDDLAELKNKINSDHLKDDDISNAFEEDFPITTSQELLNFDKKLLNNEVFLSFVKFLRRIGGSNPYEYVKRAMSRLMTDTLATEYSVKGAKGKLSFSTLLSLMRALYVAVPDREYTEKKIDESLGSWLRHSTERLKKKNK